MTLSEIVILVTLSQSPNALRPIAVTGSPPIVSGMTTSPAGEPEIPLSIL